ncbi:biopolymer transporter ExbD [Aquibium sp. A9E412]|uniref:biopolymer transporter ExbD n=1 Tax=Aquibium sp. A9E412 TaxID=2976767 RepID=UPI0025B1533E|nr:biopolymer transporter ExbD [Aquibium sp. A9E412]MDN2566934.1 biopolymer transporter ExbD [Aquibium sp. A9E412]
MRLERARAVRRPLSLTPLIDVIFLLLLFFMLSSTFTRFAEIEIAAGHAGSGAAAATPDVLIVLEAGRWQVNGARLERAAALDRLATLEGDGAQSAVLMVREGVTTQAMIEAIEAVRRETGLALSLAR